MALFAATGMIVRTTADDLYKRVFTVQQPAASGIRAAFFVDGKTGIASHVAGLVGEGVVLNSQEGGARVRGLESLSAWFWNRGSSTAIRGLDRGALERIAREGNTLHGLDGELSHYFSMGA
jgi:murein DD-endopeptidase